MKRKIVTMIMATVLLFTMVAVVNAAYGSEDDPLITLSYFDKKMAEQKEAIIEEVKKLIPSGGSSGASTDISFVPVQLSKGQKVEANTGAIEILLRRGSFVAVDPLGDGLVNLTAGSEAHQNDKLVLQNLYMIARADGRGVKAEAEDNWVMVRGDYKVIE